MFSRITLYFLPLFLFATALLGQGPTESPQRGATENTDLEVWYNQPFIWIGAVILILIIVLLMLRGKGKVNMISKHNT